MRETYYRGFSIYVCDDDYGNTVCAVQICGKLIHNLDCEDIEAAHQLIDDIIATAYDRVAHVGFLGTSIG